MQRVVSVASRCTTRDPVNKFINKVGATSRECRESLHPKSWTMGLDISLRFVMFTSIVYFLGAYPSLAHWRIAPPGAEFVG